jgi:hypothetical protein
MNSFLKAYFPARTPKRHGQGLPRCALEFPFYDMGARPHASYKLARSAKKANRRTGSVQPPCGYTPFHLRRNQRSRRRTAAQGACNRPAVILPSIFTTTTVKEANHRTRSMQPPRGCAPPQLRYNRWSNLWHGAQAHMSYTRHVGSWVQERRTAARSNVAPPRGRRKRL